MKIERSGREQMPMPMKILWRSIALSALIWCGAPAAWARPLDEIQEAKSLRIVAYLDNAPFSWEEKDGSANGIDVEIGRAIARELGVDAEGKCTGNLLCFQYLFGFFGMECDQSARTVLHVESCAVGCHARFAQGVELFDALLLLFVQFVH